MATIAENISRIQTAKTNLKTAIEAKGVTVPSATTIDGYATLVGQISQGGGGSSADYKALIDRTITSVTIPNSVTSIGNASFSYCTGLTSVTIPNSVTSIGQYAFRNCTSLASVTIPNSVTSIGYSAFANCTALTSVTIPNSVTSIGSQIFQGCTGLTSVGGMGSGADVEWSNTLSAITPYTFNFCTGLASVTIPSNVTSLNDGVFEGCSGLTSITIPSSVTSIGEFAFHDCTGLTSVTVEATTPPVLGSYAFDNTNNCPIYVPSENVETYKAASGWSTYASRIQAIPSPVVDDSNVTYVVNAPSAMTTKIFGYDYDYQVEEMVLQDPSISVEYIKVDGETVNLSTLYSNDNDYQLTQGQHTIKYKFNETNDNYSVFGMIGVFVDGSIVNSIVFEEGLDGNIDGRVLVGTTIDLPDGVSYLANGYYVQCTNLYLRNASQVVGLDESCLETECVECNEYDPEDPEVCIDCAEEECIQTENVYPQYTNLYVPSALVSAYEAAGWSGTISAISE